MKSSQKNRVRLSIEALEHRDAPTSLAIAPPEWANSDVDDIVKEITASAKPGLANGRGHDRPFHAEDSGEASIEGFTVRAHATGQATHLGNFTLNDTSTIVGFDIKPSAYMAIAIPYHLSERCRTQRVHASSISSAKNIASTSLRSAIHATTST